MKSSTVLSHIEINTFYILFRRNLVSSRRGNIRPIGKRALETFQLLRVNVETKSVAFVAGLGRVNCCANPTLTWPGSELFQQLRKVRTELQGTKRIARDGRDGGIIVERKRSHVGNNEVEENRKIRDSKSNEKSIFSSFRTLRTLTRPETTAI